MKRTHACTHPHGHTYTTPRDTTQTHRQQTRPPVPQQSAAGTTGAISSPPLPPAAPPTEQGSGAPLPPAGLEATGGDRSSVTASGEGEDLSLPLAAVGGAAALLALAAAGCLLRRRRARRQRAEMRGQLAARASPGHEQAPVCGGYMPEQEQQ